MNRGYVVKEDREGKNRDYEVLTLLNNTIKAEKRTEVTGAEKSKLFPSDIGHCSYRFPGEIFLPELWTTALPPA